MGKLKPLFSLDEKNLKEVNKALDECDDDDVMYVIFMVRTMMLYKNEFTPNTILVDDYITHEAARRGLL